MINGKSLQYKLRNACDGEIEIPSCSALTESIFRLQTASRNNAILNVNFIVTILIV